MLAIARCAASAAQTWRAQRECQCTTCIAFRSCARAEAEWATPGALAHPPVRVSVPPLLTPSLPGCDIDSVTAHYAAVAGVAPKKHEH